MIAFALLFAMFNMAVFLVGKYYFCSDLVRAKDDEKIKKMYPAYIREDMDKIHILWSFPLYCTFIIRFFIGWCNIAVVSIICVSAVVGVEDVRNL